MTQLELDYKAKVLDALRDRQGIMERQISMAIVDKELARILAATKALEDRDREEYITYKNCL